MTTAVHQSNHAYCNKHTGMTQCTPYSRAHSMQTTLSNLVLILSVFAVCRGVYVDQHLHLDNTSSERCSICMLGCNVISLKTVWVIHEKLSLNLVWAGLCVQVLVGRSVSAAQPEWCFKGCRALWEANTTWLILCIESKVPTNSKFL